MIFLSVFGLTMINKNAWYRGTIDLYITEICLTGLCPPFMRYNLDFSLIMFLPYVTLSSYTGLFMMNIKLSQPPILYTIFGGYCIFY